MNLYDLNLMDFAAVYRSFVDDALAEGCDPAIAIERARTRMRVALNEAALERSIAAHPANGGEAP